MILSTSEHPRDGSPMVHVPDGPFSMGLPATDFLAEDHEMPERVIHLSSFWIDVYPVDERSLSPCSWRPAATSRRVGGRPLAGNGDGRTASASRRSGANRAGTARISRSRE